MVIVLVWLLIMACSISSTFVVQIVATIMAALALWELLRPGGRLVLWINAILPLIWLIVLVQPFDIAIRDSDHFSVQAVPVYRGAEYARRLREAPEEVVVGYRQKLGFARARSAVLLTVPVSLRVRTPLFDDPQTPFLVSRRERVK